MSDNSTPASGRPGIRADGVLVGRRATRHASLLGLASPAPKHPATRAELSDKP